MPKFADVMKAVERMSQRGGGSATVLTMPEPKDLDRLGKMERRRTDEFAQAGKSVIAAARQEQQMLLLQQRQEQQMLQQLRQQVEQEHTRLFPNSNMQWQQWGAYNGLGYGSSALDAIYPTYAALGLSRAPETAPTPKRPPVEEPSREMLKRLPVETEALDLADPRTRLATDAEALLGYTPLRKELRTPGTLRRVLARLEIQILDEASVDSYKAQMVEHMKSANKMSMPTWRLTNLRAYAQPVPEFVLQKAVEIKRELPEAEFWVDQLAVDPFLIVTVETPKDWSYNQSRKLDPETQAYIEAWSEPRFEATM